MLSETESRYRWTNRGGSRFPTDRRMRTGDCGGHLRVIGWVYPFPMGAKIVVGVMVAGAYALAANVRSILEHRGAGGGQHRAAEGNHAARALTPGQRRMLQHAIAIALGGGALLALAACGGGSDGSPMPCPGDASAATAAAARVPRFSHVVVIVFENKTYQDVIGSRAAPTFNRLAHQNALLTNYCGVAHPSLPNYLALVSGSTHGITDDCTDCTVDGANVADTLEAHRRTWKTYAEGLPRRGFTGAQAGRYAKKHDPLAYFHDVTDNPARLSRIVPLDQFDRDLTARALPDYALVAPDLCHDMHDCSVSTGDAWLRSFMPRLLASPELRRGVVFIVFDEADKGERAGGGGHTIALAAGPTVQPGSRATAPLTHYNLLRTIEDAWGLPRLGHSASATPILGVWRARA